jgi:hypothetical protein
MSDIKPFQSLTWRNGDIVITYVGPDGVKYGIVTRSRMRAISIRDELKRDHKMKKVTCGVAEKNNGITTWQKL